MNHTLLTGAAILAAVTFSAPASATGDADSGRRAWKAEVGKVAPTFTLPDTSGRQVDTSKFAGKTIVLEWFNPECPFVVGAHGDGGTLSTFASEADARDDTVWFAINSGAPGKQGTGAEKNREAREAWGMTYPVLLDESGWVGSAFGAKTTPHMIVIDPDGKVAFNGHDSDVRAALEAVWAGEKPQTTTSRPKGCSVKYHGGAALGFVAPDFTGTDLDGNEITLSDHLGEIVVLEWFNPECPVVKGAHGDGGALETTAARYEAEGVTWLAINSGAPGKQGHGVDRNRRALADWSLRHPLIVDESGDIGKAYGATTTPHMFVIDPLGRLAYTGAPAERGASQSALEAALDELLAGKQVSVEQTKNFGCSVKYAN